MTGISSRVIKMAEKITDRPNEADNDTTKQSATTQDFTISQPDLAKAISSIIDVKYVFNQELLSMLQDMGFSENASKRALYYTGGQSVEAAIEWVDVNSDDPDLNASFVPLTFPVTVPVPQQGRDPGYEADDEPDFKMIFAVNSELGMGVGKVAAQVAHAALGLYLHLQCSSIRIIGNLSSWEVSGGRKVVVAARGSADLETLRTQALAKNIPHHRVKDAGRTQVPAGSVTVLALFGSDEELGPVTGHLKLL